MAHSRRLTPRRAMAPGPGSGTSRGKTSTAYQSRTKFLWKVRGRSRGLGWPCDGAPSISAFRLDWHESLVDLCPAAVTPPSPRSLAGHTKAVTALHLDASGARLLSGSHDYQLRMFDFGGMKADLRSFRSLEPAEGHPVVAVSNIASPGS